MWRWLLFLPLAACLQSTPYSALGYACTSTAECDEKTLCVDGRCKVPEAAARPDATLTGVPPGTVLTPSGTVTVTQDGLVLENLDIVGCLRVEANRFTLRRSRITCGENVTVDQQPGKTGLVLEDLELVGPDRHFTLAVKAVGGLSARRIDLHHFEAGFALDPGTDFVIENNYLHDLYGLEDQAAGFVSDSGVFDVFIRRNHVDLRPLTTGAPVRFTTSHEWRNVHLEHNWLEGGEFGISIAVGTDQTDRFTLADNRFGRGFAKGPLDIPPGMTLTGNVFDDDNSPVQ
ncbi:MAG: hypothetical protein IPJ65_28390 [Archangiaceae bacterium]|nr:hypothetical protein [Archangiaceae bacterium]